MPSETIADGISIVGGGTTTPTGADYTPSTGSLILTVNNHGLTGPSQHSITTANYNPIVGILTITVPATDLQMVIWLGLQIILLVGSVH